MPDNISYIVWLDKSKSHGVYQEGGYFERWINKHEIACTSIPIKAKKYRSIKSALSRGGAITRSHNSSIEEFLEDNSKNSFEFVRYFSIGKILNTLDLELSGCRIDTIDYEGNVTINGGSEALISYISSCIESNQKKNRVDKYDNSKTKR